MRPQVRSFRDKAMQACRRQGIPFRRFLDDLGLADVLAQADADNATPREIALRVLLGCCIEAGQYNRFVAAIYAIHSYLNDSGYTLGQQGLADLASILNASPTPQALRRWLDAHCP